MLIPRWIGTWTWTVNVGLIVGWTITGSCHSHYRYCVLRIKVVEWRRIHSTECHHVVERGILIVVFVLVSSTPTTGAEDSAPSSLHLTDWTQTETKNFAHSKLIDAGWGESVVVRRALASLLLVDNVEKIRHVWGPHHWHHDHATWRLHHWQHPLVHWRRWRHRAIRRSRNSIQRGAVHDVAIMIIHGRCDTGRVAALIEIWS